MSVDYVIQHAAPTLAGIKTGNLFPCFFSSPQAMVRDLRAINQVLVPRGLRLLPLRRDNTRVLLYLFRPAALSRDLSRGEARRLVEQGGVAVDDEKITDFAAAIPAAAFEKGYVVIRKGKKVFHKAVRS